MYGPPSDCKGRLLQRNYSLRKCIRPLGGEFVLRAHDDDSRVLVLVSPAVFYDLIYPQVFLHAV